jgi:hypothetical protein
MGATKAMTVWHPRGNDDGNEGQGSTNNMAGGKGQANYAVAGDNNRLYYVLFSLGCVLNVRSYQKILEPSLGPQVRGVCGAPLGLALCSLE